MSEDLSDELGVKKSFIVSGPKEIIVREYSDSDESQSSSEDDGQEETLFEFTPEYFHIQKLVKYIKAGNQTATTVSLCCLLDHDLTKDINRHAIMTIGGLETLINILESYPFICKIGSIMVLKTLARSDEIKRCIADLGGIEILLKCLGQPARDMQILVAETIHYVAQRRKGRMIVRKCGGIPKLVDLLDVPESFLSTHKDFLNPDDAEMVDLARASIRALWSVSLSKQNIHVMMKSGVVPILTKLLRSVHMDVIIPTAGTLSRCGHDPGYQLAIQTQGMIKDLVTHLSSDNADLRRYCAEVIFKCSEDASSRDLVRLAGGLAPLVILIKDPKCREDKKLFAALTGAIWKTAKTTENVMKFDELKTVETLVGILENVDEDEEVLSNVVGALSECLRFEHNRETLRHAGGVPFLVNLLNYTYPPLLENVPMVLRECANEEDSMRIIEELDGVRLIWSLLRNDSPKVQANAAWALVPCIRNAQDSGEMVRCFVGGLELIVSLLKAPDTRVLACICAAIAEVAKDLENLAVISDHGVVPLLVNLVYTEDVELREHLASAIAYCCAWGANCKQFGRLGAITPLVKYMTCDNPRVHRTTALALFHLSKNAFNCITMHESGVIPFLLKSVYSNDEELEKASAGCLANIRKLVLEAETYHLVTRGEKPESSSDDED